MPQHGLERRTALDEHQDVERDADVPVADARDEPRERLGIAGARILADPQPAVAVPARLELALPGDREAQVTALDLVDVVKELELRRNGGVDPRAQVDLAAAREGSVGEEVLDETRADFDITELPAVVEDEPRLVDLAGGVVVVAEVGVAPELERQAARVRERDARLKHRIVRQGDAPPDVVREEARFVANVDRAGSDARNGEGERRREKAQRSHRVDLATAGRRAMFTEQ